MGHKVIGGSPEFMGENAESFSFPMFLSESRKQFLTAGIFSKEKDCSFGECPFEMNVTDLFAAEAEFLACRFFGAFDESAVGGEILNAGESGDVMDFINDGQSQNLADSGDGTQAMKHIGIMLFSSSRNE